jgi:hypothetical protein
LNRTRPNLEPSAPRCQPSQGEGRGVGESKQACAAEENKKETKEIELK